MTAVEWLAEQMEHPHIFNPLIEKALEMEKQQQCYSEEEIAIAYNEGQAYSVTGKLVDGKEWVKTHKKEWFKQFKNK